MRIATFAKPVRPVAARSVAAASPSARNVNLRREEPARGQGCGRGRSLSRRVDDAQDVIPGYWPADARGSAITHSRNGSEQKINQPWG